MDSEAERSLQDRPRVRVESVSADARLCIEMPIYSGHRHVLQALRPGTGVWQMRFGGSGLAALGGQGVTAPHLGSSEFRSTGSTFGEQPEYGVTAETAVVLWLLLLFFLLLCLLLPIMIGMLGGTAALCIVGLLTDSVSLRPTMPSGLSTRRDHTVRRRSAR